MAKCKITLNGKEIEVEAGRNLVDVAEENGVDIPHYCYHPGLSIAGQCRMCYVELEGNPKLQVACNMKSSEGLKVVTQSPKIDDAVKWSLEFHLVNHPIDCPICDQAGECGLQEYYMKHGKYKSEMHEDKELKPKAIDIGDHVMLDKERCILCTRCVRYTREISKTNELGIFNRGDRSVIGTVDDQPLTGNYQLNVVDICPVGALTSKDFRFEQRVWFLDEAESICDGCSKGCNVYVHHKKGKHIYRLKPRYNAEVNSYWMCDQGRYTYKDANFDRRLTHAKLGGVDLPYEEALTHWASDLRLLLSTERANEIGVWLTPHQTNEELSKIFTVLSEKFGISRFFSESIDAVVQKDAALDNFLLRSDPYPNSRGFLKLTQEKKIKLQSLEELLKALEKGSITHLVIFSPEGERQVSTLAKLAQAIKPSHFVVLVTPQKVASEMLSAALSLPTLSHYEKSGSMINHADLTQKLSGGFKMFKESRSIEEILQDLADAHSRRTELREKVGT
jgi:NADH-quinone oxidoreductase subunit G